MSDWIERLDRIARHGEDCVLVTVAAVRGSAPREPGARMIVTRAAARDTIGGGNLEAACVERAREMLATEDSRPVQLVRYPLGAGFGQCCGGVATILFERVVPNLAAWLPAVQEHVRAANPAVVITAAEGRRAGAKLVIGREAQSGTLGDAALDAVALRRGRALLSGEADPGAAGRTASFPRTRESSPGKLQAVLDPRLRGDDSCNLSQGDLWAPRLEALGASAASTLVFIEPVRACDFEIALFGAGHVGRALVNALADVECRVTWVDSRAGEFPAAVPAHTRVVVTDAPEREVDRMPAGAYFLVMTHSHPLDFELCERALRRGDFAYLGLIGSAPKRARFLKGLKLEGVPESALARLTCPIGVPGIASKRPAAIALSVAAQILQVHEAAMLGRHRGAGQATTVAARRRAKRG